MYSHNRNFLSVSWKALLLVVIVVGSMNLQAANLTQADDTPIVYATPQFETQVTTHTYAQGLSHESWRSDAAEPMDLVLDVYEPVDAPGNRPAILIIHGGAFQIGTRTQDAFVRIAEYYASRGWVAISIDYRLLGDYGTIPQDWQDGVMASVAPESQEVTMAVYPASRDAKAALRWVYANAETYQINTNYITAFGVSAGASLAVMLGTTNEETYRDELTLDDDPTLATTNLDQPAVVRSVVGLSMSPAAVTLLDTVYGINVYDETDAPTLFVHGTEDTLVDISEAEAFRDAYEETGVYYEFYPIEGADHTLQNVEVDGKNLVELAFEFIVEQQGLVVEE